MNSVLCPVEGGINNATATRPIFAIPATSETAAQLHAPSDLLPAEATANTSKETREPHWQDFVLCDRCSSQYLHPGYHNCLSELQRSTTCPQPECNRYYCQDSSE